MITGRYGNTSGRPFIEGRLIIPSQNISTNISFLVDTGADTTVLMPMDGTKIGLDYSKLTVTAPSVGVGGFCKNFIEDAIAVFLDEPGQICVYIFKLMIVPPSPDIMDVPALLGRNIIDRWRINYDPTNGILQAEVRSADAQAPVPAAPPTAP
jgi:predicted aspartyl protease